MTCWRFIIQAMIASRSRPFLKICCTMNAAEARLAWSLGADALGLVSHMPSGPGVIADTQIAQIARSVPPPVATFLLTSRQDAASVIAQHRQCRSNTIQFVDSVPERDLMQLREALPGIALVQVIHVNDDASAEEALRVAPLVDAVLLDSGNQKLPVKELGGTGRTHDWRISARIREGLAALPEPKPVFLAGGLHAGNVREAIEAVRPYGLDVCSGVRTDGKLDAAKLSALVAALA
jgi:phosphoribosylanthranilate isomerase